MLKPPMEINAMNTHRTVRIVTTDTNKLSLANAKVVSFDASTNTWYFKFRGIGVLKAAKPKGDQDAERFVLTARTTTGKQLSAITNKLDAYQIEYKIWDPAKKAYSAAKTVV